jgi:hypothetical protein
MKKQFLILALLTVILVTQSTFVYSNSIDSLKTKRLTITTSLYDYILPLTLNSCNINIGSEIYLKNRESFFFNIGVIKSFGPSDGWFDITALNTQGTKIQIEGKRYFSKYKITGAYLALHSFYQYTKTDRPETIEDNTPPYTHYSQNIYIVNRNVIGLNSLVGYQCIKKHGLTVDCAVGFGVQYISSNSKNRVGDENNPPENEKDLGSKLLFDKGAGVAPNIVLQLRLGWKI